jgi:hypothetical protein
MLMPSWPRLRRAGDLHRLAVPAHLALVGLHRAVDDLHQRALAGAVLAQHGVDLAGLHAQVHAVVGAHGRVLLADAGELESSMVAGPVHRGFAPISERHTPPPRRPPGCVRRQGHPGEQPLVQSGPSGRRRAPPRTARAATGPGAQSHSTGRPWQPGSRCRSRAPGPAPAPRRAWPRAARFQASAACRAAPAPCRRRPACAASTGWCRRPRRWPRSRPRRPRAPRQSNRPLPRNRLLLGQKAIWAPLSRSRARSSSSSQMPCASTLRGCSRPWRSYTSR